MLCVASTPLRPAIPQKFAAARARRPIRPQAPGKLTAGLTPAGPPPNFSGSLFRSRRSWAVSLPAESDPFERHSVNVSVENVGPCKKLLRVELDAAAVDAEFETVTKEFIKHASLPGFRPGKAPRPVVERTFAARITEEVKKKLLPDAYKKALDDNKLRPIGYPDIEEGDFGRGQGLKFTATLEVEPDFELPDYTGIAVKRENRVVTDEDVERAVNSLREQHASFTDVARPAQADDFVVVNYTGACDGKPITDLAPAARGLTEQKNFWMHVTPDHFIPGFTAQLVGAKAGDRRTVTVTFPADFAVKEVSGKQGVFEVEVVQVKEKSLPALDEAFARSFGAENLEKLRAGVRADLENELKFKLKRQVRDQLVATLLGRVSCELPEGLVQNETRSAVYDIVRSNQERGVPKEAIDEKKDEIYGVASNSARERVKAMLILTRIGEKEGIKVTKEELSQRIYQLAAQHQVKPDKLIKQLQERNGFGQIQQQILLSKVLDLIELHAQIEELPAGA
jgi:trigger factor